MVKTSIILPCYNVARFLRKAIESVLAQSEKDFELLIIIDNSPDDCKSIAQSFAATDDRVYVFEKKHGGLSDSRNYGLSKSTGRYVYFMDSDDWIDSDLLEKNLEIIEREKLDFIEFGYTREDEDIMGKHIGSEEVIPACDRWIRGSGNIVIDDVHLDLMGYAWNKIYCRSFLELHQLRFEKGLSLVEDVLFNCHVFQLSKSIRFNARSFYHYANRPVKSLLKTFHPDSFELNKRKIKMLKSFFKSWGIKNEAEIMTITTFISIRYCILNLLYCTNDLSVLDRIRFLRNIYNDELTKKFIPFYVPQTRNNRLCKFLIENKMTLTTCLVARLYHLE